MVKRSPRIDPKKLMETLTPLLNSNGGMKSEEVVHRFTTLMCTFSKKMVSKVIYVQILQRSEHHLLSLFLEKGGWTLICSWLSHAIKRENVPLLIKVLELVATCPVTVDRLKSNDMARQMKGLSKGDETYPRVKELASNIVQQWLAIVRRAPIPMTGGASSSNPSPSSTNSSSYQSCAENESEGAAVLNQIEAMENGDEMEEDGEGSYEEDDEIGDEDYGEESSSEESEEDSIPIYKKITIKDGKHLLAEVMPRSRNYFAKSKKSEKSFFKKEKVKFEDFSGDVDSHEEPEKAKKATKKRKSETIEKIEEKSAGGSKKGRMKDQKLDAKNLNSNESEKKTNKKEKPESKNLSDLRSSKSSKISEGETGATKHKLSKSNKLNYDSNEDKVQKGDERNKDAKKAKLDRKSSDIGSDSHKKWASGEEKMSRKSKRDKPLTDDVIASMLIKKHPSKKCDDPPNLKRGELSFLNHPDGLFMPPAISKLGKIPKLSRIENKDDPVKKTDHGDKKTDHGEKKTEATRKHVAPPVKKKVASFSFETKQREVVPVENKPKTVKTFHSKFRLTGLEEPVPIPVKSKKTQPPSDKKSSGKRASPTKDATSEPPSKKIKSPEHTHAVEEKKNEVKSGQSSPSTPKPSMKNEFFLQDSGGFMDAILTTATLAQKERKKKKPATALPKVVETSEVKKESGEAPPLSKLKSPEPAPRVDKPKFTFYKDTLESSSEDLSESVDSISSPVLNASEISIIEPDLDVSNISIAAEGNSSGLRSSLSHLKVRTHPKKSVSWKEDEELTSILYFECDASERTNVSLRNFSNMQEAERNAEREMNLKNRKIPENDKMRVQIPWTGLVLIDFGDRDRPVVFGENSEEKNIQMERAKCVPPVVYCTLYQIPDSPAEPDPVPFQIKPVFHIPLDEVPSEDREPEPIKDYSAHGWPAPKVEGSENTANHVENSAPPPEQHGMQMPPQNMMFPQYADGNFAPGGFPPGPFPPPHMMPPNWMGPEMPAMQMMPGMGPGMAPGMVPGMAQGLAPGMGQGLAPGMAQGMAQGMAPMIPPMGPPGGMPPPFMMHPPRMPYMGPPNMFAPPPPPNGTANRMEWFPQASQPPPAPPKQQPDVRRDENPIKMEKEQEKNGLKPDGHKPDGFVPLNGPRSLNNRDAGRERDYNKRNHSDRDRSDSWKRDSYRGGDRDRDRDRDRYRDRDYSSKKSYKDNSRPFKGIKSTVICRNIKQHGKCTDKDCRFLHPH